MKEDICSILQCAGLIHDIGNPPFGHFGESAIREWFERNLPRMEFHGVTIDKALTPQMREDFYHFEGNAQALRLVTKLHFLVDENGMNLTYALLNTIVKYPVPSTGIDEKSGDIKDKMCIRDSAIIVLHILDVLGYGRLGNIKLLGSPGIIHFLAYS